MRRLNSSPSRQSADQNAVLIYGGSFDPPHRGHIRLLQSAIRFLKPSKIHVVVSPHVPLKGLPSAPAEHRLKMLKKAARSGLEPRERRGIVWDLFEIRRRKKTYTYHTLRRVKRLYPRAPLYLLMGSDCLAEFTNWRHWRHILKICRLLVGRRQGEGEKRGGAWGSRLPEGSGRIAFLPETFPPLSSTGIRRLLHRGEPCSRYVPEAVRLHIENHGLYDRRIHRWLKRNLSPDRYRHTLAVTDLAVRLAQAHGQDPDRARTAALLHDAGRALSPERLRQYAGRRPLGIPKQKEVARRLPILLHAYVSADMASKKFGIRDPGILRAIRLHTLGSPRMTILDRVLYVADAASEDRGFKEAIKIREESLKDLNRGFRMAVRNKLQYVLSRGRWLHPQTVALWNHCLDHC